MYEVGVVAQFEAAHRLQGDFGPAARMHGHTYRLEVILRGGMLREDGTLFDLGRLGAAVDELAGAFNYRELSEVPGLEGVNTTAEVVADYCWRRLAPQLRDRGLTSLTVRVWESPRAYASCERPLAEQAAESGS